MAWGSSGGRVVASASAGVAERYGSYREMRLCVASE